MKLPAGYTVAVISPKGRIIKTFDLDEYDLAKAAARADIALEIEHIVHIDYTLDKLA